MDQELAQMLEDIRSDLVEIKTELVIMKFALEKVEAQVEEMYNDSQKQSTGGMRIEKF